MFKGTIYQRRLMSLNGKEDQPPAIQVVPLAHPLLETFRWDRPDGVVLLSRERCREKETVDAPDHDWDILRARAFCEDHAKWPLDYQAIFIDTTTGVVEFTAGHGGVTPLYIRVTDEKTDLSWSIADFYPDLSTQDIDVERAGLRLTGTSPYAATTMFRHVYMLTERASLTVAPGGPPDIRYPAAADYYMPTPLREHADIPAVAANLVEALLDRWPVPSITVASEFSGGLDSAVIAAILSRHRRGGLPTYALQISGPARDQQTRRRDLAIQHFRFRDRFLSVDTVPMVPFTFARHADYQVAPYNADLQRSLRHLLAVFTKTSGALAVATGTGGDELLMAHAFEQDPEQFARNRNDAFLPDLFPSAMNRALTDQLADYADQCDRAPFPVLPISILEAHAARAPLFAEHGLWPVSPFAQPEAVRFYRSLPLSWRQNKTLHRRLLQHLGYPEEFLVIPQRENFETYLTTSLVASAASLKRELMQECRLHELGLVDVDRLMAAIDAVRPDSDLADVGFLFHAFNVEYMLRRLGEAVANAETSCERAGQHI